jgi:hypothetical protein
MKKLCSKFYSLIPTNIDICKQKCFSYIKLLYFERLVKDIISLQGFDHMPKNSWHILMLLTRNK